MNILGIYNKLVKDIHEQYTWKYVTTCSMTYDERNSKIHIYCNEFVLSQALLSKYSKLGYTSDEIVLQICGWIRERINPLCVDLKTKYGSEMESFEIVYRWRGVHVFTDFYAQ